MNEPPPANNCKPTLLFLLLALALFCAASCSEDPIDAASVQANLILDWEDDQSLPSERLSVFIELSSNVRRVESFTVASGEYSWNVDSPILFESGGRQWAGWPHLEPPPAKNGQRPLFPLGNYEVECVDAAGKKDKATFSIIINAALLDANASQVEGLIHAPQKRVAVYSDSGELLYFDSAKSNWLGGATIFNGVKDSSYYRDTIASGSALCFMPKKYKDNKENKNGEQSDGLE